MFHRFVQFIRTDIVCEHVLGSNDTRDIIMLLINGVS